MENKAYNQKLKYFRSLTHNMRENLAVFYNSNIYKKNTIILNAGDRVQQFYILKQGVLKVEKQLKLVERNRWPTKKEHQEIHLYKM